MVTIGTCTSLTWQGRHVVVPGDLIVEIGEVKYLKVQPTNRSAAETQGEHRPLGSFGA